MGKYQLKIITFVSLLILTVIQLLVPFVATAQEITGQARSLADLEDIQIASDQETNQLNVSLSLSKPIGDISEQIILFSKEVHFVDNENLLLSDQNGQTIGVGSVKENKLRLSVAPTYQGLIKLSIKSFTDVILPDTSLKITSDNFSKEIFLPTNEVTANTSQPSSLEETANTEKIKENQTDAVKEVNDLAIPDLISPALQTINFGYTSDSSGNYLTNNDQGTSGQNTLNYAYGATTESPFDTEGYVNYNDEAYVKKTVKEVTGNQGLFDVTLDIKGNELPNPIEIALIVDYSSTMNGQKLQNTINGIEEFLDQIDNSMISGKVRVGIIAYNRESYVQPFTENKEELVNFLEDTSKRHSGTFIQKGLVEADNLFETSAKPDVQRKMIVHIGDGSANRAYHPVDGATLYTNDGQIIPYNGFSAKNYYRDFSTDSTSYYSSSQTTVDEDPVNATFTSAKELANLTLGTSVDLKLKGYDFYSIGVAPSDRGEYIAKNLASTEAKYLPIDADLAQLGEALSNVAAKVEHTIPNGTVLDPMGEQILLKKSSNQFSPKDYTLQGSRKDDTGTWINAPELLNKIAVSEADNQLDISGITLGKDERLSMTYQIRIDTEASSFIPDHWYLANGRTTLDTTSKGNLVDFPIPSVKAPGTKITVEKNWLDNNNVLGLRPDAISFVVTRTTVTSTAWQESQPILLSKPDGNINQWQIEIDSVIPKNETASVSLAAFNNQGEDFLYSVKEVNTDPNYISTINSSQGKIVLTNQLNRTNLTFTKVNEKDQPLQGVSFKLLDDQGQQIGDIQSSDKDGSVTFFNLEKGNYQLIEVTPLPEYEAIQPIQLIIDRNSAGELAVTAPENWSHKVVNKKITVKTTPSNIEKPKSSGQIPKAGEKSQSWLVVLGIILIVSIILLYFKNKQK
ncbi:SpaA isopeptide-forming pilin-related protein [Enterococcus rotai]|uniref:SpaA isopeptide-forming pilin-related protein n=1 Tax=Enterococcus rotai TaxID=118060 RepID=UPI0032B4C127